MRKDGQVPPTEPVKEPVEEDEDDQEYTDDLLRKAADVSKMEQSVDEVVTTPVGSKQQPEPELVKVSAQLSQLNVSSQQPVP